RRRRQQPHALVVAQRRGTHAGARGHLTDGQGLVARHHLSGSLCGVRFVPRTSVASMRFLRLRLALLTPLTLLPALLAAQPASQPAPWPPVATFSILGYDPETGEVSGAVQSRVFSVGNGVLWAEAEAGAAATQAIVDVSYGPQALALLKQGVAPAEGGKQIREKDPDP